MVRFQLPAPARTSELGLGTRLQGLFLRTWRGRLILTALAVLVLGWLGLPVPGLLDGGARLVLCLAILIYGWRAARVVLRALLFKIRTKLLVSYVFIAVVPVVLLGLFFALTGVLFSGVVASYLVTSELERQGERLEGLARRALEELDAGPAGFAVRAHAPLARLQEVHPEAAWSLACAPQPSGGTLVGTGALPDWWKAADFRGFVKVGKGELLRVALRSGSCALIVDAPLDGRLMQALESRLGIYFVTSVGVPRQKGMHVKVDLTDDDKPDQLEPAPERELERGVERSLQRSRRVTFVVPISRLDWETGKSDDSALLVQFDPRLLVRKLTPGPLNLADKLMQALAAVAVVFLFMYAVALLFGGVLARSITRSVHQLSRGTQRLRQGDFEHRIAVKGRDQLGELAESFNLMAGGIQDLLRQQGEKERLEEELRIARQIQMSLLPQNDVSVPGLRVSALCLPAAEVGGDYYDLLPLSDERLGVLVADVSGKGTSAALYMAELKGLVLSLSRVHDSPAKLLCEANRILAQHLDSRTFITMTYAIVDVAAGRMRFARAGHNPLIRLPAGGRTEILAPAGLGLGMDRGERFDAILEEAEVPLQGGDILVFFTDGLSEAMNPGAELFGERRLRDVIQAGEGLSSEELKERILAEIRRFVSGAAQHDDMTLVILKVV